MATDKCVQENDKVGHTDMEEGRQVGEWISQIEESGDNKSESSCGEIRIMEEDVVGNQKQQNVKEKRMIKVGSKLRIGEDKIALDTCKDYLERTLVQCKGSVEKAKKQIDRLCTMKTLIPKFFSKTNVKMELQSILKIAKLVPLPIVTEDYYRILMIQISNKDLTNKSFMEYFQFAIILAEYLKANDYVNGFVVIYDCRQLNLLDMFSKLNTVELQQFITILIEGYGARLKSIHMITDSKAIELVINTIKQFVSEKIGNRMYAQRTVEDLHKVVPQELLPVEYGGKQKSVESIHADVVQELSSLKYMEYVKMMFAACSDETKRHVDKFNEDYMGMPGSFRCLTVD